MPQLAGYAKDEVKKVWKSVSGKNSNVAPSDQSEGPWTLADGSKTYINPYAPSSYGSGGYGTTQPGGSCEYLFDSSCHHSCHASPDQLILEL